MSFDMLKVISRTFPDELLRRKQRDALVAIKTDERINKTRIFMSNNALIVCVIDFRSHAD